MAPTVVAWSAPQQCQSHSFLRTHIVTRVICRQFRRAALKREEPKASGQTRSLSTFFSLRRCRSWRCAAASEEVEAPPGRPEVPNGWQEVVDMQAAGTTWRGEVESVNRGGVVVDVHGLRGFIPLSRLAPDRLQALDRQEDQKGQPIAAKIIKVNVPARELILSEQATIGEAMAATLTRGDVVEGVVTRVVDFGAFVSLKSPDGGMHGAMGLIHITELAWSRVSNPESVVQPGDHIKCKVVKADAQTGKIGLSLKKMESDPLLENLDDLLPVTDSSVPTVPANLPSVVEDICTALMEEEEIEAVDIGRQVKEKRAVSQDLELWISKEAVQDGHALVVRTGRLVQEINVTTRMSGDAMKTAVQRVLRKMA